ncbi:efflux RND transporter periplasmic adaptor subunit [Aromatoleum toluvorans]|uniref:Efflux RND transporter periplasmic adaptor subunit n=1 Tax=Aromatoleum toluvorans TaxID=92002 RepID=A0ABX1Q1W8_9RHOO|nr:efflux RND transporter periplasmic adaptor subunit [Aromatoleum toluvorans]NMG45704.1 efflux RND transporter periplasmic adaptor subunit [Aromatoleum toluvorans]
MKEHKPGKQKLAIALVLVAGVALGAAILNTDKPAPAGDGHGEHSEAGHKEDAHKDDKAGAPADAHEDGHGHERAEPVKGPHGGKLLGEGPYTVEVTIFETGVEPQFRVYTYLDGKPLDPARSRVELTLERLGQPAQVFRFTQEEDYLKGDAVVSEPHSFEVTVRAEHDGKSYELGYAQAEARVAMSDAQLQGAGVEIAEAGPATIGTTLSLLGEVRYDADRTVHVVPRLAGLVEAVKVNAGDRVKKGQVLAVLSSHALADQRSALLAAQRRLALARTTYEREKTLWEQKISPEQDMLQARAAMQEAEIEAQSARQKLAALGAAAGGDGDLTRYELRAPIDGVVTDKRLSVGAAVGEDATVFTVSDLSTVWVEAPVAARDLPAVTAGRSARVAANAFDATAEGRVTYVSALIGEHTRSATARIVVKNDKGQWRPGLPVTVEVLADEARVPVAVAAAAIQDLRDWKVVFGRYGDAFEARPLELGRSDGRYVEVLGGLRAGERYAAKNSFVIKAELGKAGASHDH